MSDTVVKDSFFYKIVIEDHDPQSQYYKKRITFIAPYRNGGMFKTPEQFFTYSCLRNKTKFVSCEPFDEILKLEDI